MELMNRWTKAPWNLTPSEASVMGALEEAGPQGVTLATLARDGLGYMNPYEERVQWQVRRVVGDVWKKLGKGSIATTSRGYALGDVGEGAGKGEVAG